MPLLDTEIRALVKRFRVPGLASNSGMATIGQRVRKLREEAGLSRPALAAAVGMKTTTLQTLEEKPQRTTRYLVPLAAHFHVSPEWLATGKGQREAPVKGGLDEYAWTSQFGNYDRQSLSLALQWLRWQTDNGLESQPERRVDRFIALYRRFLADGGRETAEHLIDIATEQGKRSVQRGAAD
jgi:transcriptional regulator with XRE-family HTH domain